MIPDLNGSNKIFFQFEGFSDVLSSNKDLIRLIPFGVQLSADGMSPLLILKDEKGDNSMPVPLNPLEAGIALTQSNKTVAPMTAHRVTEILLTHLNLKIEQCTFTEIKNNYQYVHLVLSGHPDLKFISVRADEAMSLCFHLQVPIYATKEFMIKSRVLHAESKVAVQATRMNPDLLGKNHKYIM